MKPLKQITYLIMLLLLGIVVFIACQKGINKDKLASSSNSNIIPDKSKPGSRAFCAAIGDIASQANGALKSATVAKAVTFSNTVFNTDFVSAGVGGLRNVGSGTIVLAGLSGTITKAYLYWHGITNSSTDVGNSIIVNGSPVNGTNIGYSDDNCWGFDNSQAYKADVTALVQATGNGNYALSGFGSMNPNGASLIVFFNDGNPANNRDVVIFDGNDSNVFFPGIGGNPNAPLDPEGWDVMLSGINYTAGTVNIQLHVADGQYGPFYTDAPLILNGSTLDAGPAIFEGTSVPGANNGPLDNGNLWDIKTYNITSFLSPGPNNLHLTAGVAGDCLGLIVALIDLPVGAAPGNVSLDIKPTSCPNPLNTNDQGVLPAAILGTTTVDVTHIDVATLKLNGVSPTKSSIEDVAAPYTGLLIDCSSCTTAGPDGKADLTLKFNAQDIVASLGAVTDGQCLTIEITGNLLPAYGGTPIIGRDNIRINKKK